MSIRRIREYPTKQPFESTDKFIERLRASMQEEAGDRIQDFDILQLANVPWVDVREYQAKGDGVTDDTVAIQAAADSLTGGGVLFFPDGTYLVSGSGDQCIQLKYSIRFVGQSMKNTIFKLADAQTVFSVIRTKAASTLQFVQFENFTVDGNKANQTGVQSQNGLHLDAVIYGRVKNVYVHDVYSNDPPTTEAGGIVIVDSWDVHVDSSFVKAIDGYGIYYGNVTSAFLRGAISNCYAAECGSYGINSWNVKNILVSNCHGYNNYGGFSFEDSYNISVIGCSGYLNTGAGIWINETSGSLVIGCQGYNNGGQGILVSGTVGYVANDNIIIGNRCADTQDVPTQDYGIYEGAYATGNLYIGNNIKGNIVDPLYLSGAESHAYFNKTDETIALASAAALTLPTTGDFFTISGTTNITSMAVSWQGRRVCLKFDGILTFTAGNNLKIAGDFTTSADDTITLVSDGVNWYEESRSANA